MDNIAGLLSVGAQRTPDAIAIANRGERLSYSELDELVWRVAALLVGEGVARGEVVAVSCRAEMINLIATFAIARIGASVLALPSSATRTQRVAVAARCAARRVVTDDAADDHAGLAPIVLDAQALARSPDGSDRSVGDPDPAAPWLIVIGSGSTGSPKRIDLSHRVALERARKYVRAFELVADDRCMCAARFDFAGTKHRVIETFAAGGALMLWDRRARGLAQVCRDERVTVLNANVVHLEHLLSTLDPEAIDVLGGLRILRVGGSTILPRLRESIARRLTPRLYVAYAMNEFGLAAVAYPEEALAQPESIGKAVEGVELQIVDERDRAAPAGTVGQVRVRGAGMVDRYVGDEAASAIAFRDGWFYPGDLAMFAPQASVIYRGRADRTMILDGINIHPAEIEAVMLAHPAVEHAVALPLRSKIHQDVPVCAVELGAGQQVTPAELRDYAAERLGVARPRKVVVLDRIPRNEQGKVMFADLVRALGAAMGVEVKGVPGARGSPTDGPSGRT